MDRTRTEFLKFWLLLRTLSKTGVLPRNKPLPNHDFVHSKQGFVSTDYDQQLQARIQLDKRTVCLKATKEVLECERRSEVKQRFYISFILLFSV